VAATHCPNLTVVFQHACMKQNSVGIYRNDRHSKRLTEFICWRRLTNPLKTWNIGRSGFWICRKQQQEERMTFGRNKRIMISQKSFARCFLSRFYAEKVNKRGLCAMKRPPGKNSLEPAITFHSNCYADTELSSLFTDVALGFGIFV